MTSEKQIEAFARYRRKQIAELRPYIEGEDVSHVSISPEDAKAGSPRVGDMIARNPKNHADQWLVAHAYFLDNFEPLTAAEQAEPKAYNIGDATMERVFKPSGLTNVHDLQAVFDAVERALMDQAEPAPAADAPLGAVENGRVFLQRLVDHYDFQCEAGGLASCSDYHEAVRCFEAMAEWIYQGQIADRDFWKEQFQTETRVRIEFQDALSQIANAYTAHGYSDAMDAVQNLKDIAKEALNAVR